MTATATRAARLAAYIAETITIIDGLKADLAVAETAYDAAYDRYDSRKAAFLNGEGSLADLKAEYRLVLEACHEVTHLQSCIADQGVALANFQEQLANKLDILEMDWLMEF